LLDKVSTEWRQKMNKDLGLIKKNDKFIVTKNGEPISLPKTDGQNIITEFSSKEDAEKYINILSVLLSKKK
jgi:hypothetical protein